MRHKLLQKARTKLHPLTSWERDCVELKITVAAVIAFFRKPHELERVEAERLKTIRGKTRKHFLCDPVLPKSGIDV